MLVTLSGIVISMRLLQSRKALYPMLVTPSGIVAAVIFLRQPITTLFDIINPSISSPSTRVAPQLFEEVQELLFTKFSFKNVQLLKAKFPMLFTLIGILIEVRVLQ
jgi:hypothetical protein